MNFVIWVGQVTSTHLKIAKQSELLYGCWIFPMSWRDLITLQGTRMITQAMDVGRQWINQGVDFKPPCSCLQLNKSGTHCHSYCDEKSESCKGIEVRRIRESRATCDHKDIWRHMGPLSAIVIGNHGASYIPNHRPQLVDDLGEFREIRIPTYEVPLRSNML